MARGKQTAPQVTTTDLADPAAPLHLCMPSSTVV